MEPKIKRFFDEQGRLKQLPAKSSLQAEALSYLSTKFTLDKVYSEKEVNRILTEWSTLGDYFVLRRGLVDRQFLSRTADGSQYWRNPSQGGNDNDKE